MLETTPQTLSRYGLERVLTALNNNADPKFNIALAFRQLAENAEKLVM